MGARRVDFGSQKWVEKKEGQKVEEKWSKIVQKWGRLAGGSREDPGAPLAGPGLLALKIID